MKLKVPSMIAAEFRRLTASKMGILALIALMCVPILYGGLYLWANQDPYGKFAEVPVALVVDDHGATQDDKAVNFGTDVADELQEDGAFDWRAMSASDAQTALDAGDVDFTVTLPADFSDALVSASGTDPHQARIELETNDANNYLASSIGTQAVEKIRATVAKTVGTEAAGTLLTALSDVRDSLGEAADGAAQLEDGATQLNDGAKDANSGSKKLAKGSDTLADGTSKLSAGAADLASGARTLSDGAAKVNSGNRTLADRADTVASAAQRVTDKLPEARKKIAERLAEQGMDQAQIDRVLSALDPLADDVRKGNAAAQQVVSQLDQLADGASQVASGAKTLANGANTLSSGASTAADGASSLRTGAHDLHDGIGKLQQGTSTLLDGTTTLHKGLSDGQQKIPESSPQLREKQADVISDPIDVSSDKVASAEDYGAGLAPFFAALAAWIGIYALFLIVKPISRRAVTALHSPVRVTLAGWLTPATLGALQMVGLLGVLAIALGFTFHHPIGTLGVLVFASVTFAAIILTLNVWLGSVGQFLGLVLMVLQLVTAGGTFPWQTLPAPLAALHHVLPLGYVVDAMRQLMYDGGNIGRAWSDLGVLAIWLVVALALTAVGVARMTRRRTLRDLQPSLIG